jgi:hypothetical protein
MLRISAPILTALACVSCASSIYAKAPLSLENRIDASFSSIKTGLSEEEAKKLKNVTITGEENDGITVTDNAGVMHDFYDGLWQKIIHIKPNAAAKPIRALGIGTARNKKSVLNAIGKFTGNEDISCGITKGQSAWEIRKFGTHLFCQKYIGKDNEAYVWVAFDKQDRLIVAGYQAWDPF